MANIDVLRLFILFFTITSHTKVKTDSLSISLSSQLCTKKSNSFMLRGMRVHSKQSRGRNTSGLLGHHRLFIVDGINVPLNYFLKENIVALNHSEAFNKLTVFLCLPKDC